MYDGASIPYPANPANPAKPNFNEQERKRLILQAWNKLLYELDPANDPKYTPDDKGMSFLFSDLNPTIRYNTTAKEYYYYNGNVWVQDTGRMQALKMAKVMADSVSLYAGGITVEEKQKEYLKIAKRLGNMKVRETIITDARTNMYMSQTDFDKQDHYLNLLNGTLNLETMELQEHKPSDYLCKQAHVNYKPDAKSELWIKFIDDIMCGNKDKIKYLQKALGYSLTADTNLETCFILYGATTRNGKGTLTETIRYMLGGTSGYSMTINPATLSQQDRTGSQANSDIARLNDCRFLNASEPPKKMLLDVALFKILTGRDSITARHLYQSAFEFTPKFKLFINTNYLPRVNDDTLFKSNRINVITFDKHFPDEQQDSTLKTRLTFPDVLSGILNWCLEGLKLYREEGLKPPACIQQATNDYRQESDKLGAFIEDALIPSTLNSKLGDVYKSYVQWCNDNGYTAESKGSIKIEFERRNMYALTGTVKGSTERNVIKGYVIKENMRLPFS